MRCKRLSEWGFSHAKRNKLIDCTFPGWVRLNV